jgi:Mce-associated membrane protein
MTTRSTDEAAVAAAQAEAAEAEAAEAQALAAAAAARAKAARLRQQAEESRAAQAKAEEAKAVEITEPETATETVEPLSTSDAVELEAPRTTRNWLPGWKPTIAVLGVLVLIGLWTGIGLMIWSHHKATQREELQEQFAAGARQGVINLMSLNFNNGQADLQRVLDTTTGSFHDDFEKSQKDFLTVMQDSKVVTSTSVDATAVESMTDDSASVLITATSQVANNASQQPTPRSWRLSVTVQRDNGQVKMSKVEFVP